MEGADSVCKIEGSLSSGGSEIIGGRLGAGTRGGGRADSGGEDGRRGRCAFAGDVLLNELALETRCLESLRAVVWRRDWAIEIEELLCCLECCANNPMLSILIRREEAEELVRWRLWRWL